MLGMAMASAAMSPAVSATNRRVSVASGRGITLDAGGTPVANGFTLGQDGMEAQFGSPSLRKPPRVCRDYV
jgi:hypothetical protein